ncbi:MAG: hypothetical protein IJT87_04140 [Ruminiclostridium sp.]|nr:hypothetical protein [Ruminiclostridium sp.]
MICRKYPDDKTVDEAVAKKEPLIIAISFDEKTALMSHLDDSVEHHILLQHFGIKATDIDKYWRIVVDGETAEWTFVCPRDYKNIKDRQKRITAFYNDGITAISKVISDLGYFADITIPRRYRRHFDAIGDDRTYSPYM